MQLFLFIRNFSENRAIVYQANVFLSSSYNQIFLTRSRKEIRRERKEIVDKIISYSAFRALNIKHESRPFPTQTNHKEQQKKKVKEKKKKIQGRKSLKITCGKNDAPVVFIERTSEYANFKHQFFNIGYFSNRDKHWQSIRTEESSRFSFA